MLRAWPVDDRVFEPKANLRPVGVQMIRERPGGEKPYGLRPRERPVAAPKPNNRPVDGVGNKLTYNERPAGAGTLELMIDERPESSQANRLMNKGRSNLRTRNEHRLQTTDRLPTQDYRSGRWMWWRLNECHGTFRWTSQW